MKLMKGFKMANLNINSLLKYIDELREIMVNTPVDILSINETKIDHTVPDSEISVAGYNTVRKDRNRHGGGVLMYIRESIPYSERSDLVPNPLEILCVEISRTDRRSFLVSSWYRPPNSATHLFDCYENFIQKCDVENKEVIIKGDLNCDVLKPQLDSHSRKLEFLSSLYEFDQLINCPTIRVTETSATAIDSILTNRAENILKVGTVDLGISDHSLIFAVRKGRIYKCQKNSRYLRNFKRFRSLLKMRVLQNTQKCVF